MSETPDKQPEDQGSKNSVSQADIDALINGQTPEIDAGEQESSAPAESGPASQADIDAMFGVDGDAAQSADAPADTAGDAATQASPTRVNQADIDALLGSAGEAAALATDTPSGPDDRLDSEGRPFDEAAAAMAAAIAENPAPPADQAASGDNTPLPDGARPVELQEFDGGPESDSDPNRVTLLNDVNLRVKIELGKTRMLVEDVLKLGEGSVVELDKLAGDPVDVLVNDRLIARGEVLVLNDSFCVRISEVLSEDPHRISA